MSDEEKMSLETKEHYINDTPQIDAPIIVAEPKQSNENNGYKEEKSISPSLPNKRLPCGGKSRRKQRKKPKKRRTRSKRTSSRRQRRSKKAN